jgi:hypothetical protein
MASARLQFKQHAYIWKDIFTPSDQNARQYASENDRLAQLPQYNLVNGKRTLSLLNPNPSTEDVIDRFVHHNCQLNIDRFLYRRILLHFLEAATMDTLKQASSVAGLRYV